MTTPKLRFKGFEELWEQKRLQEFAEKVNDKNEDNTYKLVFTDSALYGVINQNDFFKKNIANSKNINKYTIVKDNYYIYNPRISKYAKFGPIRRNKLNQTGIVSPMYFVFKIDKDISNVFLDHYFLSNHWYSYVYSTGNSGARSDRIAIKDSDFMNMPILIPNYDEQNKIGDLLLLVGNKIEIQQRKLDNILSIKYGYLQKLFPMVNENEPKLKFNCFDSSWNKVKLDDISNYKNGKGLEKFSVNGGEKIIINLNSISVDGYLKDSGKRLPKEFKDTLKKGDLIMILSDIANGDLIGMTAVIPKNDLYALNQRVGLIKLNDKISPKFMSFQLNNMQKYFKKKSAGTSQLNLSKGDIMNACVYKPDIVEQRKIANLMTLIDNKIELLRKELDILKLLKKGYLQKMFV